MLAKILLSRNISLLNSNVRRICLTTTNCCEKIKTEENKQNPVEQEFQTIYKFPYIRALSTVNRLKTYQLALTGVGIPLSVIGTQMKVFSNDAILLTSAIGVSGCMVLFSLSYITQKFVGFVYLNETEDKAKVSYMDFWGKRKDEIIHVDDIVPMSDMQFSIMDGMYMKLRRYSTKDYLKLNVTLGSIVDKEKFRKVFK